MIVYVKVYGKIIARDLSLVASRLYRMAVTLPLTRHVQLAGTLTACRYINSAKCNFDEQAKAVWVLRNSICIAQKATPVPMWLGGIPDSRLVGTGRAIALVIPPPGLCDKWFFCKFSGRERGVRPILQRV